MIYVCICVRVTLSLLEVLCYPEIILFTWLPRSLMVLSYIRMSVTASLLINIIGTRLQQILARRKVDMLKNTHSIFRICFWWWECRIFLNCKTKHLACFHPLSYMFVFPLPFPFYSIPHLMCLPRPSELSNLIPTILFLFLVFCSRVTGSFKVH